MYHVFHTPHPLVGHGVACGALELRDMITIASKLSNDVLVSLLVVNTLTLVLSVCACLRASQT